MDIHVSCRLTPFFILLTIIIPISADQSQNINPGSTLVAGASNSTSWKSPNGDFAFSFQELPTGLYLLAITYDKLPTETIVWSANRNTPVEKGSTVELSVNNGLVLRNPNGKQIWTTGVSNPRISGAMLDTGNFVLTAPNTKKSTFLWQSFDHPTDTLLPGQVLNQNESLFSSFSESNYSIGRFRFIMQLDGNLVMYPLNYPKSDQVYSAYWATDTYSTNPSLNSTGFQFVFNESGRIYLVARNGTTLYSFSSSSSYRYMRLTLDPDGVLRQYWVVKPSVEWSVGAFQPSNICVRVTGTRGGGACGLNSVCELGNDKRPKCSCLKGYSIVDPKDSRSGCKPDFVRQGCLGNSTGFALYESYKTDWANSEYDYFEGVEEEWCRQVCLEDCFCDAAVFRGSACWKMGGPLRNGRVDPGIAGKALMKIPSE